MPVTNDLVIRDVVDDDVPRFFEQQSDPAAIHMVAFTAKEPADREAFTAKWDKIRGDGTTIAKTVVVDGVVVGNVLSFVAPWSGKREIGYWLGKEYWSRGIATRAISILGPLRLDPPRFRRCGERQYPFAQSSGKVWLHGY